MVEVSIRQGSKPEVHKNADTFMTHEGQLTVYSKSEDQGLEPVAIYAAGDWVKAVTTKTK